LSYAAAMKLDMIREGTSLVEVTAIGFDKPARDRPTAVKKSPQPTLTSLPSTTVSRLFVQVGAFGERSNAARRLEFLSRSDIDNAFIFEDKSSGTSLFRVRVGPVADVIQYDLLVEELEGLGITDPYLISE
jgi:rare lipoprotein A